MLTLFYLIQYPLPITDAYLKELKDAKDEEDAAIASAKAKNDVTVPQDESESAVVFKEPEQVKDEPPIFPPAPTKYSDVEAAAQADTPDVRPRFAEKKRLVWTDKTCTFLLALLMTGRRISLTGP